MTVTQQIITVAAVVLGTMLTRFLPFFLFPAGKETPRSYSIWEERFRRQFSDFWLFTA